MINYVVRRRYSGYVGGIQTQQAFTTGFNNCAAYFKYNYRKSEFSLSYNFNYRDYDKRGLTYRHKYDAWLWGAEASLMLGPWTVSANFYNTPKSFYGENMNGGENTPDLNVMYRWKNLCVGLGAILVGYPQGYEHPGYTDSRYFKSYFNTIIKDNAS